MGGGSNRVRIVFSGGLTSAVLNLRDLIQKSRLIKKTGLRKMDIDGGKRLEMDQYCANDGFW